MPESISAPEGSRAENKLFGRHKWRGKPFSGESRFGRDAGDLESTDDDIANFLRTGGTRPETGPQSIPLAPRIDLAAVSKLPSAPQAYQDNANFDVYRRAKPRQNKGLRVRFESAPSVVIGVGGDEAELPSRYVSRSFADSVRSEQSPRRESLYKVNDQRSEADPSDETSLRAPSLRRRPTGIDDELLTEGSHHADPDRDVFQSAFAGIAKSSPRPRNQEQNLDPNLRERDVQLLSYKYASKSEDLSHDQSHTGQTAEIRSPRATRHLGVPPPETLPADSVAPTEPPEPPYASQEVSSSSRYFPPATEDLPKLHDSGHQGISQDIQDVSCSAKDELPSPRSVAKTFGDESLDDFDSRVRRLNDLFRLNASADVDIMAVPFKQWVRTSAWWFLRGRGGLESAVRSKPSSTATANAANDRDVALSLRQAYINLAKAWWMLNDVTPNLPEIRRFGNANMNSMVTVIRSFGDQQPLAELVEVHLGIIANMRALAISMKKNGRLPPNDLQMQRLESQIFLETPTFPPYLAALMVNNLLNPPINGKNYVVGPFFPIVVGDTDRHFSFGKMFVDTFLDSRNDAKSGLHVPCVVSVLRERTDWAVKAAVTSQDGQVNLVIQSGGTLNWHNVQWKIPLKMMQVGLAEGISLHIKFSDKDFKTIWGIYDYTQRIRKDYSSRSGEEVLYERELPKFQCFDSPSFPAEPIKDCRVRLFKKEVVAAEGSGQHRAHDGHRLMVITPPGCKTLSNVNYQLGKDSPILFGTHPSKGGSTLLVKVLSSLRLSLTFHEASDVELFRSTLAGTLITENDSCSAFLPLRNFTINSVSAGQDMVYMNAGRCFSDLRWHQLRVINGGRPNYGNDSQPTICSKNLRILVDCHSGTFTDRVNAGPGELQLTLSVENLNEIKLLRAAQQDTTWSFADGVLRETDLSSLSQMLHTMGMSASVRTYHFRSLSDLHSFQAMLTGFHVLYDGLATTFSISRPRMVVPLYKRWEASTPRLQIIKQDKTVQLVAFFKDFSHGACMNFVLKVTDVFDTFARSGGFFLRIVDAKFALPKGQSDPARDFVCLDIPAYPGEHDDIIIGFDNEQGDEGKCS